MEKDKAQRQINKLLAVAAHGSGASDAERSTYWLEASRLAHDHGFTVALSPEAPESVAAASVASDRPVPARAPTYRRGFAAAPGFCVKCQEFISAGEDVLQRPNGIGVDLAHVLC